MMKFLKWAGDNFMRKRVKILKQKKYEKERS